MSLLDCPACTFKNKEGLDHCEICLTELQKILPQQLNQGASVLFYTPEEALVKYNEIVSICKSVKEKFVDDTFPPLPTSVCKTDSPELRNNPATPLRVARWFRPSDYLNGGWKVFDKPKPSDIIQGSLGDCWLMSALSVVAERQELLLNIIQPSTLSQYGVYVVNLCIEGQRISVIIDDLLPQLDNRNFAFSYARNKQLWVSLIEKGVAKYFGNYESLVAGRCFEGLNFLTGSPCESFTFDNAKDQVDPDFLWAQLISCRNQKFLMGASCGSGNMAHPARVYTEVGLNQNHAYSVLDLQEVDHHRVVKLRNPWGQSDWCGDWSNVSELWNDTYRKHLKYTDEKGIFWISFKDLLQYFDSVDVCRCRPDWYEYRFQCRINADTVEPWGSVLLVSVFSTTQIEAVLYQTGVRTHFKNDNIDLMISVFRMNGDPAAPVIGALVEGSNRTLRSSVGCYCILEPGQYLVVGFSFNRWGGISRSCSLVVHSSKKVLVERLDRAPKFILADGLIQVALARGVQNAGRDGMTVYYLREGYAGMIIVVENRYPDHWIHVKSDCTDSMNVVCTRSKLGTCDSIPPLHRQVILVLSHLEDSAGYVVTNKISHRVCKLASLKDWGTGCHVPDVKMREEGLHSPRPI